MRTLAIVIAMLAAAAPAKAAEIDAFISTALKTVTDEVIPPFERAGGHTVRALYATSTKSSRRNCTRSRRRFATRPTR